MGINLQKGGTINLNKCIDLTKRSGGLNKVTVGLGWDINRSFGDNYDLDAMAACLDSNGVLCKSSDFIYFGNKNGRGLYLTGDNLTGEGDGDDEQIIVSLSEIPQEVKVISFAVVIYQAASRGQKFGNVDNAFIHVIDNVTGQELVRFNLTKEFTTETGVIVGEFERESDGSWKFNAIGKGLNRVDAKALKTLYSQSNPDMSQFENSSASTPTGQTYQQPEQTRKSGGFFSKLFGK